MQRARRAATCAKSINSIRDGPPSIEGNDHWAGLLQQVVDRAKIPLLEIISVKSHCGRILELCFNQKVALRLKTICASRQTKFLG